MPDNPDYTDSELMEFMEQCVWSYVYETHRSFRHEIEWHDGLHELKGVSAGITLREAVIAAIEQRKRDIAALEGDD